MKPFEYTGLWRTFDEPEVEEVGTLTYTPSKGLVLKLVGRLTTRRSFDQEIIIKYIFGFTTNGKSITLVTCRDEGGTEYHPGIATQKFKCDIAFIGRFHLDEERMLFNRIRVRFTHLLEWMGIESFQEQIKQGANGAEGVTIDYTFPKRTVAHIGNTSVSFIYSLDTNYGQGQITLLQNARMEISVPQALSLLEWRNAFVSPLQDLISIATGRPNAITNWVVYKEPLEEHELETNAPQPFEVYFQPVYYSIDVPEALYDHEMIFSLKEVGGDLATLVEKWLTIRRRFATTYNLYLSTQYNPSKYTEPNFLSIAQAIELYHRVNFSNRVFSKSEFRERRKAIVQRAPKKYQNWADAQLEHANEPRLGQRVLELYDAASDLMRQFHIDRRVFAGVVKDTRNYYTHYSPGLKTKALNGAELYWLTRALSYMFVYLFLGDIGFDVETRLHFFERNTEFKFARNALRKLFVNLQSSSSKQKNRGRRRSSFSRSLTKRKLSLSSHDPKSLSPHRRRR